MSTPELSTVISNLIREYKQRKGNLTNHHSVPEDQGQGIPLGGLMGDEGGLGNHEPGPGTEVPKLRKPTLYFESTNIVPTTNPFHADVTRANVSTIVHPQIPDYSVLQTSMQAMSEGLLKTILKEGIAKERIPLSYLSLQAKLVMKRLVGEGGNSKLEVWMVSMRIELSKML